MTVIFDGKKLVLKKLNLLRPKVEKIRVRLGRPPKLVVLMVGENQASRIYVREKQEAAEKIGIAFEFLHFPSSTAVEKVVEAIKKANNDGRVDGVMVQLPIETKNEKRKIPSQSCLKTSRSIPTRGAGRRTRLEERFWEGRQNYNLKFKILNTINVAKDVDCLTEANLELVRKGRQRYLPATVRAVLEILSTVTQGVRGCTPLRCARFTPRELLKESRKESKILVVGSKGFVGRPLVWMLQRSGFQVKGVDLETKDLARVINEADVLISATGQANLIKEEMVKKGAVVIDVGYPQGDVDFEAVKEKASLITPVPGGVGPMTVVSLLENLLVASKASLG